MFQNQTGWPTLFQVYWQKHCKYIPLTSVLESIPHIIEPSQNKSYMKELSLCLRSSVVVDQTVNTAV